MGEYMARSHVFLYTKNYSLAALVNELASSLTEKRRFYEILKSVITLWAGECKISKEEITKFSLQKNLF